MKKCGIKKLLPAILMLLIIIGLSSPILAQDNLEAICEIIDTDSKVTQYSSFADALDAVQDGETIKLLENIDYNNGIVIIDKCITFDVNGKILNVKNDNGHGLEATKNNKESIVAVLLIDSGTGGQFNVTGGGEGGCGVYVGGATVEVTNASTTATDPSSFAIRVASGTVTVYGNVRGGEIGVDAFMSNVTVYGNVSANCGVYAFFGSSEVTVYGHVTGNITGVLAQYYATITLKGNVHGGREGVSSVQGAKVIVDGKISTDSDTGYIVFEYKYKKMQEEHESTSSLPNYFEYMYKGDEVDDPTYIWVKIPGPQYTVTYAPGDYGTFDEVSYEELSAGETTPAAPDPIGQAGWKFTGWSPARSETVTGDVIYVAQWEKEAKVETTYTVIYDPGDHGTFDRQVTADLSEGAATPAAPDPTGGEGWLFAGWSPGISETVTDNVTYVAQWKKAGTQPITGVDDISVSLLMLMGASLIGMAAALFMRTRKRVV